MFRIATILPIFFISLYTQAYAQGIDEQDLWSFYREGVIPIREFASECKITNLESVSIDQKGQMYERDGVKYYPVRYSLRGTCEYASPLAYYAGIKIYRFTHSFENEFYYNRFNEIEKTFNYNEEIARNFQEVGVRSARANQSTEQSSNPSRGRSSSPEASRSTNTTGPKQQDRAAKSVSKIEQLSDDIYAKDVQLFELTENLLNYLLSLKLNLPERLTDDLETSKRRTSQQFSAFRNVSDTSAVQKYFIEKAKYIKALEKVVSIARSHELSQPRSEFSSIEGNVLNAIESSARADKNFELLYYKTALSPKVEERPDQLPQLIGGLAELQKNVLVPQKAKEKGVKGRVYVEFIVDESGEVLDPKIVQGLGYGCDEEAIRVIKGASYEAGRKRGRPVKAKLTLPVLFRAR